MQPVIGAPYLIGNIDGPVSCTHILDVFLHFFCGTISIQSSSVNGPCRFRLVLGVLVMEQTDHSDLVSAL